MTNPPPHHSLNPTPHVVNNDNGYYYQQSPLHQIFNTNVVTNNNNNVVVPQINNVVGRTSNDDDDNSDDVGLSWEEWPFEYPVGYRFQPTDYELIVYYLMNKISNSELPHDKIKDVDLYQATPEQLTAVYEPMGDDNKWYFFTPRMKKYKNGKRPDRAAGTGYWKATGADIDIKFQQVVIGYKTSLVFFQGKPPKGTKTNWIMHEYRLHKVSERKNTDENDMTLDDWVLCRIYNNSKDDNKASSSTPNPAIPVEDNNCDTQTQQNSVVAEDEKPPQPIASIEDFMENDQDNNVYPNDDGHNGFLNSYEANNPFEFEYSMEPTPTLQDNGLFTGYDDMECYQELSAMLSIEPEFLQDPSSFPPIDQLLNFQAPELQTDMDIQKQIGD